MFNQHSKRFFHHYSLSIFVGISLLFLLGSVIFLTNKLFAIKTKVDASQTEVNDLQEKVNKTSGSTVLSLTDINGYQSLLSQLIPDTEDTFSILYTLEKISTDTGFVITQYVIDPSSILEGKLSVEITGGGNLEAFLKFIDTYRFGGGRFVSSNIVDYKSDQTVVDMKLNFYAKKAAAEDSDTSLLVPTDMEFLNKVKEKTAIVVPETISVGDYKVSEDPFSASKSTSNPTPIPLPSNVKQVVITAAPSSAPQ